MHNIRGSATSQSLLLSKAVRKATPAVAENFAPPPPLMAAASIAPPDDVPLLGLA